MYSLILSPFFYATLSLASYPGHVAWVRGYFESESGEDFLLDYSNSLYYTPPVQHMTLAVLTSLV